MHRAWYIEEIRLLLLDQLENQDLARLTQSCKSLFDPATDELWKTIPSFTQFSKILLDFQKTSKERPLQPEDLTRLDLYGFKVRKVLMESQIEKPISIPKRFQKTKHQKIELADQPWDDAWAETRKLRSPTSPFLPNVRHIRVNHVHEGALIPLIGISGANLNNIYIKFLQSRREKRVVRSVLEELQDYSKLEYLYIRDGDCDLIPTELLRSAPLKQLRLPPRIESGYFATYFNKVALQHDILEVATLENLTISLSRQWYSPKTRDSKAKFLPSLKILWLDLSTFKADECYNPTCINKNGPSWTCKPEMPQWRHYGSEADISQKDDCGRRPPTVFFDRLDNPQLNFLKIKFPAEATKKMITEVLSAANRNCQLQNLEELSLAGAGWDKKWQNDNIGRRVLPEELREAVKTLLVLRRLRFLKVSVATNFLDGLDLGIYQEIANGFPALETLFLGHRDFMSSNGRQEPQQESVELKNLAAFCSMLPNLVEVSISTINVSELEESPHFEWASPLVKILTVNSWIGKDMAQDHLSLCLLRWFPNSNLAKELSKVRLV